MKIFSRVIYFFIRLILIGCSREVATSEGGTPTEDETITSLTATPLPPTPLPPTATPVPDPEETVKDYLEAWKVDDYAGMYAMLTGISRDAITEEEFTQRYRKVMSEAAVGGMDYQI